MRLSCLVNKPKATALFANLVHSKPVEFTHKQLMKKSFSTLKALNKPISYMMADTATISVGAGLATKIAAETIATVGVGGAAAVLLPTIVLGYSAWMMYDAVNRPENPDAIDLWYYDDFEVGYEVRRLIREREAREKREKEAQEKYAEQAKFAARNPTYLQQQTINGFSVQEDAYYRDNYYQRLQLIEKYNIDPSDFRLPGAGIEAEERLSNG